MQLVLMKKGETLYRYFPSDEAAKGAKTCTPNILERYIEEGDSRKRHLNEQRSAHLIY